MKSGGATTRKWRVRVTRWDVYEARGIEAETEAAAVEIALACYELDDDLQHIDGGVLSTDGEEEEDD